MQPLAATHRTHSATSSGRKSSRSPNFRSSSARRSQIITTFASLLSTSLSSRRRCRSRARSQFPQVGGLSLRAWLRNVPAALQTTPPVSFGLNASWTPDFWGLYRKQTEVQRDQLLAQQWAQRAVRLTLVQQVAAAYLQLRALDNQLIIAQQTLKARQDSLNLTQTLESGGAAPLSDVRQAEELVYTASSQIPQIQQQIQQQENALHLLLGENPGPIARASAHTITPPPQDVPTGLPSQLLARRPDIEQAEAQLKAANANIGVARAQFFPQLSLSGEAGGAGENFANLLGIVLGSGSITQPIFEGGKLRGQLNLSKAQEQELVLNYQKTVAGAFHDVSNALIALNKQHAYRIEQEKLVASTQDAARLAGIRYKGGATSYLEVLTADSNLFAAQLNLVAAQQAEALALVQLYGALGGGWN